MLLPGCAQLEALTRAGGAAADSAADATQAADVAAAAPQVDEGPGPIPEAQENPKPGQLYEWKGDGRTITRIVIDTNLQRARFYVGDEQVGWTTVATGLPSHATPSGEFVILEKVADKRSNLYGKIVNSSGAVIRSGADSRDGIPPGGRFVGASMPHFMRMTYDGIGMHAGPIPRPGRPASHGCIRMPKTMASAVYRHVSTGTPVTVVGNGPNYGNYAERVRRQRIEEEARRAAAEAARTGTSLDALDAEIETVRRAEQAEQVEQVEQAAAAAAPAVGSAATRDLPPAGTPADSPPAPAGAEAAPETSPETRAEGPAPEQDVPPAEAPPAAGPGGEPGYYRPPAPPPQIRSAQELPASAMRAG
jgi:lipoprotein-anchoring transpeptidase ErfK/SrfK